MARVHLKEQYRQRNWLLEPNRIQNSGKWIVDYLIELSAIEDENPC